ncbi:hypothetical protein B0H13DRAFT_2659840 [Mycena leptocephala]|nr:hypothetical protein B0H13DRAFT_2659840 [Mycena leptocephala]
MDSPFQEILHTNAVPSDEECDAIRHFLETPLKELAGLTDRFTHLQHLLDDVSKKRDQMKECIDAHLAVVSPVRRLPEDIIRSIFLRTLPTTRNPTISIDEAPFLLCRICRSWRIIALSSPRLWASIHIVVPTQSRVQRLTDLVATWFTRSGTVPLDISMAFSASCGTECDISTLLSVLVAASRRWKQIQIVVGLSFGQSFRG